MVPKVVLDTNIIVSAFGWRGSPHQILRRCIAGDFHLHLSPALLLELSNLQEIQVFTPDLFLTRHPVQPR